jgi:hypothetical protein
VFTSFRKNNNIFNRVHELEQTFGDPTATVFGLRSVEARFEDLVRQFFRARKHHLVAAIHFKKLELKFPRRDDIRGWKYPGGNALSCRQ